jgi:hypothetical protein
MINVINVVTTLSSVPGGTLNHALAMIAKRSCRKVNGTSMESSSKPDPLYSTPSLGTVCPVCGKKSYSAAGVHPQCSVQQADAPRQAALAAKKKKERAIADAEKLRAENKQKTRA